MRVPTAVFEAELVVRRSRFIAAGRPLEDPASVRHIVAEVRDAHPGCNHVVWAYQHGPAGETAGMSDDHEPKGTAGHPVLDVIRGSGITNLLVTVTRFFGGTKLGTGGLVRAYSEAARRVVQGIPAVEYVERCAFSLVVPYEVYEAVKRTMEENEAATLTEDFQERVTIQGSIPLAGRERFVEVVREITSGTASPRFT